MIGRGPSYRFRLQRVLPGAQETVFDAHADPARLARWWGPQGFVIPHVDLDLRVGGRLRIAMRPPDGEQFFLLARFLVVDRPRRLTYTFAWEDPHPDDTETVVTFSLRAVDGTTEVTVDQGDFMTEERLALHQQGWTETLDRLERLLEGS